MREESKEIVIDKINITIKANGLKSSTPLDPKLSEINLVETRVTTINSTVDKTNATKPVNTLYENRNLVASHLFIPKHLASPISFLFSKMWRYEQVVKRRIETIIALMEKIKRAILIKLHVSSTPKLKSSSGSKKE